jgi:hypothetical protein
MTYLFFQRPGGTYALNCHVTCKDGTWEVKRPFAISESFKPQDDSIIPFHLLHADVRSAVQSCFGTLNGGTNSQPHHIKWALKEAYRIRDNHHYGFIIECLATKRAVLQHGTQAGEPLASGLCAVSLILNELFEIIELFKPTPMMLVSIRILPDEFRVQNKMPLSTANQISGSLSPWPRIPLQYMTAAGNVTAVINNNDPDLTKHAWGLKGLILSTDYLFAVMEWQHAGLVYVPPPAPLPSASPPVSV